MACHKELLAVLLLRHGLATDCSPELSTRLGSVPHGGSQCRHTPLVIRQTLLERDMYLWSMQVPRHCDSLRTGTAQQHCERARLNTTAG